MKMASGLVRRTVEAEDSLVVAASASTTADPVSIPIVPLAVLVVPVDFAGADDVECDGLGHGLLYTYCSGAPLQVVAAEAS